MATSLNNKIKEFIKHKMLNNCTKTEDKKNSTEKKRRSSGVVNIELFIIEEQKTWKAPFPLDTTVDQMKEMAMKHFYGIYSNIAHPREFQLVEASTRRSLLGPHTLREELLAGEDEILFMKIHPPYVAPTLAPEALIGPTAEEIAEKTTACKPKNLDQKCPEIVVDRYDIRQVFVELAEVSAKYLVLTADAPRLVTILSEYLPKRTMGINKVVMRELLAQGYPRDKVEWLLSRRNMRYPAAVEWLQEHEKKDINLEDDMLEGPSTNTRDPVELSLVDVVHMLREKFERKKKTNFQVSASKMKILTDMGFPEDDVRKALTIGNNHQETACEWLLSDVKTRKQKSDVKTSIDKDSKLYIALMSNTAILLGLTKPKTLLALISLLENEKNSLLWRRDRDVGTFLTRIFEVFHTETQAHYI